MSAKRCCGASIVPTRYETPRASGLASIWWPRSLSCTAFVSRSTQVQAAGWKLFVQAAKALEQRLDPSKRRQYPGDRCSPAEPRLREALWSRGVSP